MKQKMPFMIAIILICVAPMADTYVLIPAMTDIGKALADASQTQLNLILTISSLFVIPSSLIAGKLVEKNRLSKRNCLLIGFSLFTLGGATGGLIVNINYLLFTRAVLGIGNGMVTAMVVTITADYFTEKEGATVMGLYSAIGGVLAIGLTVVSGYLVLINWRLAFSVYLVCALIIIYHALVLRKPKGAAVVDSSAQNKETHAQAALEESGIKAPLGRAVWVLIAITIMSQAIGNTLYLSLSNFIEGEGLGDASSTGIANGVLTIAIVLVSLTFSFIYSKIGKQTALLVFIFMAAGFFLLSQSQSFAMALAASIIWGIGFGLSIPYVMQEAIVCPPKPMITFTGSLVNSCIFFSYVLSTFLHPAISSITGNESLRFYYMVISLLLLACGLVSVILIKTGKTIKLQPC